MAAVTGGMGAGAEALDRALADKVQAYTERAVPADARDAPKRTIASIRLQAAMKDRQVPVLEAWLREPSHWRTR